MVTHLRMVHGRKVTRQEPSGMVAHQQMFRAIVDAGCRTTPPRMLCLECSACACVCALSCAVINYLHPPLECSVLLCMRMRMLENALSFY